MYICLDCKHKFDEPEKFYGETLECWGVHCQEERWGCPHCEGDYIESFDCDICDEVIIDKFIETENGDRICGECYVEKNICET